MFVQLRQGASVGGHGEPVGVGYAFPRYSGRVPWQSVDAQRRVPFEQGERDGLSRIHGEHNSATSTIAAFTTVRCGARVDPRLLQSCRRVLSYGRPFERFGARALGSEGETFILGQGVEDSLGHRAAAGIDGADEKDLLHAFSPPWDY